MLLDYQKKDLRDFFKVGADGLWLCKENDGVARLWDCDKFHNIEI